MEGAKVRIAPPVVARSVGYTVQDQDHPRPSTGVSSLQSHAPCWRHRQQSNSGAEDGAHNCRGNTVEPDRSNLQLE